MINVKQNKMYRYLILLTISSTLGLVAWLTLFNNFAVEIVDLEGSHIGIIQSKWLIMVLYVLDQVFYNFHIAIQTYFQKIGDPRDIASIIPLFRHDEFVQADTT
jgi:hypothetical protein